MASRPTSHSRGDDRRQVLDAAREQLLDAATTMECAATPEHLVELRAAVAAHEIAFNDWIGTATATSTLGNVDRRDSGAWAGYEADRRATWEAR